MTDARKMYADLVRSAGTNAYLQVAILPQIFEQLVFGERAATGTQLCGHTSSADRITSDRSSDPARRLLQMPVYQGQIDLFDLALMKLSSERLVSPIGTSHEEDAARLTVSYGLAIGDVD